MYAIYQAQNVADAELLRQKLRSAGLSAVVRNQFLQGALGELPANLGLEVCVLQSEHIDDARELALEFDLEMRTQDQGSDWDCKKCGEQSPANFEVCWKCRTERDV